MQDDSVYQQTAATKFKQSITGFFYCVLNKPVTWITNFILSWSFATLISLENEIVLSRQQTDQTNKQTKALQMQVNYLEKEHYKLEQGK